MTDLRNSCRRDLLKQRLTGAVTLGASRRIERKGVEGFPGKVFETSADRHPWMGLSLAMLSYCCWRSSSQVAGNFEYRRRSDGRERHMG